MGFKSPYAALLLLTACDCGGGDALHQLNGKIEVSPRSLVFQLGPDVPQTRSVTLENVSLVDLSVELALDPASHLTFGIDGGAVVLPAQSQLEVPVRATPLEVGTVTGRLLVVSDDPDAPSIEVMLEATVSDTPAPLARRLTVTPAIDFGAVPLGESRSQEIVLQSTGEGPVTYSTQVTASHMDFLFNPNATASTLAAGAETRISVAFTPSAAGPRSATVTVESDADDAPRVEVVVQGAGQAAGECGHVTGIVCDVAGGPAIGARVFVDAGGEYHETQTDAEGRWRLDCVPAGSWTFTAQSGSFTTSFDATVVGGETTELSGEACLDPRSASVAVVFGAFDSMETVLTALAIPHTLYQDATDLVFDPSEMAQYDVIFFNCGFNEYEALTPQGLNNLRAFVDDGGSVYGSDLAYDLVEMGWPSYVDFFGDDSVRDMAENAPPYYGPAQVIDPNLLAALGGQSSVTVDSWGSAMESASSQTVVHLAGDRLQDGVDRPFMISFQPGPNSGRVFYTDFHNSELLAVNQLFTWLIQQL